LYEFKHNYSIGSSDFALGALMHTKNKVVSVQLEIAGNNAKAIFKDLQLAQQQIECEIGESLEWRELPDKARSYIQLELNSDPFDKAAREEQYKWFLQKLEAFHKTFGPRIRKPQFAASLENNVID
jgi:hypothetical protein